MTTAVLKMEKNGITQISFIWVIMSLTASSRSDIPRITNLECLNDFHEKIFCLWDVVNLNSNCSEDFVLSYKNFRNLTEMCHDLRNEQFGHSVVPNKCLCNIPVSAFAISESYEIEVESHGVLVDSTKIHIGSTIKPRAPSNVQVEFKEDQYGIVQWNTGYTSSVITDNLCFQVQIICKHNREVAMEYNVRQTKPEYHFNKKQLKRGENYVVRVRTIPVNEFQGNWSEWSSEAEWRNDYSLTALDLIDVIIPITCIMILCLIIVSYVCLTRYKNKWWDTIPNPAKSTIVKRKLIQKHRSIPPRKYAAKKTCGSFSNRIVKAHKSRCGQLTQHYNVQHPVNDILNSDCKKFIFETKNEDIERCVEMYPKEENENNPIQEDKPEHKAEDHQLEDLSIANMFFAILNDSSGLKIDTFENLNTGSTGCPALMDSFDKEHKQQNNLNVSRHRKLGYNNYDSNDSQVDSSSNIGAVKMPCIDQWPDNEIGCIPYTPQVNTKDNCSYQSKGDTLASPGYDSFASAVSEARKYFMVDTPKPLSPNSILYYNTKYPCSHIREDSFQPNIKPKPGEIILQCQESKTSPTYLCPVSGYQSFDQAVQENEPELGCHWTGYKSFDQAVLHSEETSVSELNGYQSFDQAVQENNPRSSCYISGYKSFEQTVQEGDDISVHEVNGYQSFDQAVQESETSGSRNCSILDSGYKPFESLICQNNDYSGKNGCICESDHLRDRQCENSTNIDNSRDYRLLSSGSMELIYKDFVKATKEKYPSFVDKHFNVLKISMGDNHNNGMTSKYEGIPLALTFDICEHLRNMENMHGHKVPLINLENGTIPINGTIFPCHLVSFSQEQLSIKKNLSLQKFPSTSYTFENASFHMPLYDLDIIDSSQTTKHVLIQQSSLDKDGNSYMKIK